MAAPAEELDQLRTLDSPERRLENAKLQIGYFLKMVQRFPLNDSIGNCDALDEAFMWQMEKDNMNIPAHLHFDAIKDSLPPEHRDRMERIWHAVLERRTKFTKNINALQTEWRTADFYPASTEAVALVASYGDSIPEQYRTTLAVMADGALQGKSQDIEHEEVLLDLAQEAEQTTGSDHWRASESALRGKYYKYDKEYITTLRFYYQMLLESKESVVSDTKSGEAENVTHYILPSDHPARQEIWQRNRYLRLIDAIHQAVAIAKTLHHQQPTGRMRETGDEPYLNHPMAVIGRFITDVVPFIMDKSDQGFDFVLVSFIFALHDLDEDTSQNVDQIIERVKSIAEKVDTTFDHDAVIKGGFGEDRETIKAQYITLLWPEDLEILEQSLQTVSKQTPITDKRVVYALEVDKYFSLEEITQIIPEEQLQRVMHDLKTASIRKTSNTVYSVFPAQVEGGNGALESDDPKLDKMVFNLRTIPLSDRKDRSRDDRRRRYPLMAKLFDRLHNLLTHDYKPALKKRKDLRGTVSRLIAYAVLDFPKKKYPLYNSLPDIIEVALQKYELFKADGLAGKHDCFEEEIDGAYIEKLREWKAEFPIQPLPEKWAQVEAQFNKSKRKTPSSILGEARNGVEAVLDIEGVTD